MLSLFAVKLPLWCIQWFIIKNVNVPCESIKGSSHSDGDERVPEQEKVIKFGRQKKCELFRKPSDFQNE